MSHMSEHDSDTAPETSGSDAASAAQEHEAPVAGEVVAAPASREADEPSAGDDAQLAAEADQGTDQDADRAPRRAGRDRTAQLEREGEVAADFLERLLDIADMDGDIDVDIDGDRASVAIVDSEDGRVPRRLVGSDGKVLEALQDLTRMAVQAATGERSRLMLDVAGHRAQRRDQVISLTREAIAQVRESGSPAPMKAMSAFERKVAHDEVLAAGLASESEGTEPHRHVVVLPA